MAQLPPIVPEVLAAHQVLSLATSDGEMPWVSQVFFAEEVSTNSLTLCFATLKPSRKWRHLQKNSRVAFAMGTDLPSRWLQGSGIAEVVHDEDDAARINRLIGQKAPAYAGFVSAVEYEVFRVEVDEIRVVDLTRGLHRASWTKP
jgi:general stress protein 26